MNMRSCLFLLLISLICGELIEARRQKSICSTKKSCKDLNNRCVCYCSHLCGPREKKDDDKPVWVKHDPNGHHCYCKRWDLKNYDANRCAQKEIL